MDLKNKIVLITGGLGGIGMCIVKKLLSSCDVKYVAIFDLDSPECHSRFDDLQTEFGEKIGFYPCDITISSTVSENFDKIIASHGSIDILINNAGIAGESIPEKVIDVNLKAVLVTSFMLIDRIGKQVGGKGGIIVNIASINGLMNKFAPVYSATKHGVVSFTRTMKYSYDATGVSVVAICPGLTETPLIKKPLPCPDYVKTEQARKTYETFILQAPERVAAALISIIRNGQSGDVWVSENNQPPYSVREIDDYKSLKIKDYPE